MSVVQRSAVTLLSASPTLRAVTGAQQCDAVREAESLELQARAAENKGDDQASVDHMEHAMRLRVDVVSAIAAKLQALEEDQRRLERRATAHLRSHPNIRNDTVNNDDELYASGGSSVTRESHKAALPGATLAANARMSSDAAMTSSQTNLHAAHFNTNGDAAAAAASPAARSTDLSLTREEVSHELAVMCQALYAVAEQLVVRCNAIAAQRFGSGDFATATALLDYCLDLTRPAGYPLGEDESRRCRLRGLTLNNMGCMERRRGHFQLALQHMRESMACTGEESAVAYMNMSAILTQLRLSKEAADMAERAVALLAVHDSADAAVSVCPTNPVTPCAYSVYSATPKGPTAEKSGVDTAVVALARTPTSAQTASVAPTSRRHAHSLLAVAHHNWAMALEPLNASWAVYEYGMAYRCALREAGSRAAVTASIEQSWLRFLHDYPHCRTMMPQRPSSLAQEDSTGAQASNKLDTEIDVHNNNNDSMYSTSAAINGTDPYSTAALDKVHAESELAAVKAALRVLRESGERRRRRAMLTRDNNTALLASSLGRDNAEDGCDLGRMTTTRCGHRITSATMLHKNGLPSNANHNFNNYNSNVYGGSHARCSQGEWQASDIVPSHEDLFPHPFVIPRPQPVLPRIGMSHTLPPPSSFTSSAKHRRSHAHNHTHHRDRHEQEGGECAAGGMFLPRLKITDESRVKSRTKPAAATNARTNREDVSSSAAAVAARHNKLPVTGKSSAICRSASKATASVATASQGQCGAGTEKTVRRHEDASVSKNTTHRPAPASRVRHLQSDDAALTSSFASTSPSLSPSSSFSVSTPKLSAWATAPIAHNDTRFSRTSRSNNRANTKNSKDNNNRTTSNAANKKNNNTGKDKNDKNNSSNNDKNIVCRGNETTSAHTVHRHSSREHVGQLKHLREDTRAHRTSNHSALMCASPHARGNTARPNDSAPSPRLSTVSREESMSAPAHSATRVGTLKSVSQTRARRLSLVKATAVPHKRVHTNEKSESTLKAASSQRQIRVDARTNANASSMPRTASPTDTSPVSTVSSKRAPAAVRPGEKLAAETALARRLASPHDKTSTTSTSPRPRTIRREDNVMAKTPPVRRPAGTESRAPSVSPTSPRLREARAPDSRMRVTMPSSSSTYDSNKSSDAPSARKTTASSSFTVVPKSRVKAKNIIVVAPQDADHTQPVAPAIRSDMTRSASAMQRLGRIDALGRGYHARRQLARYRVIVAAVQHHRQHTAACCIQQCYRHRLRQRRAVCAMQRVARGWLAKCHAKRVQRQRRQRAAAEAAASAAAAAAQVRQKNAAVLALQSLLRVCVSQAAVWHRTQRLTRACRVVRLLQQRWRNRRAYRTDVCVEHRAAIRIQALWRGRCLRDELGKLLADSSSLYATAAGTDSEWTANKAARATSNTTSTVLFSSSGSRLISVSCRGIIHTRLAWREQARRRAACVRIQSLVRGFLARTREWPARVAFAHQEQRQRAYYAVCAIQRAYRTHAARLQLRQRRFRQKYDRRGVFTAGWVARLQMTGRAYLDRRTMAVRCAKEFLCEAMRTSMDDRTSEQTVQGDGLITSSRPPTATRRTKDTSRRNAAPITMSRTHTALEGDAREGVLCKAKRCVAQTILEHWLRARVQQRYRSIGTAELHMSATHSRQPSRVDTPNNEACLVHATAATQQSEPSGVSCEIAPKSSRHTERSTSPGDLVVLTPSESNPTESCNNTSSSILCTTVQRELTQDNAKNGSEGKNSGDATENVGNTDECDGEQSERAMAASLFAQSQEKCDELSRRERDAACDRLRMLRSDMLRDRHEYAMRAIAKATSMAELQPFRSHTRLPMGSRSYRAQAQSCVADSSDVPDKTSYVRCLPDSSSPSPLSHWNDYTAARAQMHFSTGAALVCNRHRGGTSIDANAVAAQMAIARVFRGHLGRKYARIVRALSERYAELREGREKIAVLPSKASLTFTVLNDFVEPAYAADGSCGVGRCIPSPRPPVAAAPSVSSKCWRQSFRMRSSRRSSPPRTSSQEKASRVDNDVVVGMQGDGIAPAVHITGTHGTNVAEQREGAGVTRNHDTEVHIPMPVKDANDPAHVTCSSELHSLVTSSTTLGIPMGALAPALIAAMVPGAHTGNTVAGVDLDTATSTTHAAVLAEWKEAMAECVSEDAEVRWPETTLTIACGVPVVNSNARAAAEQMVVRVVSEEDTPYTEEDVNRVVAIPMIGLLDIDAEPCDSAETSVTTSESVLVQGAEEQAEKSDGAAVCEARAWGVLRAVVHSALSHGEIANRLAALHTRSECNSNTWDRSGTCAIAETETPADAAEAVAARKVFNFMRRVQALRMLNALREAQHRRLIGGIVTEIVVNRAATCIQRMYRGTMARRYVALAYGYDAFARVLGSGYSDPSRPMSWLSKYDKNRLSDSQSRRGRIRESAKEMRTHGGDVGVKMDLNEETEDDVNSDNMPPGGHPCLPTAPPDPKENRGLSDMDEEVLYD